jgi:threonine dehydrogenase-like Zn-dependent dehydrogenase
MKAVVLNPALRLVTDRMKPKPGPGEALVRVRLCGICNTDLELMKGYMGFRGVPGHEFVGEVIEINPTEKTSPFNGKSSQASTGRAGHASAAQEGEGNERSSLIGSRVVGEINAACGECVFCKEGVPTHCERRTVLGILGRDGCMAEYLTLPIENIHPVPDNVSDEAAVFVEPLAAAYEILEQVEGSKTDRILVMGDGKLGLLCAMSLSTTGAEVTLMGRHEHKMALAKPYGVNVLPLGERGLQKSFHVVVEATGTSEGFEQAMDHTCPRGIIVLKSTVAEGKPLNLAPVVINEITVVGSRCGPFVPALDALASGAIDPTPLIEATYPIDDALKAFEHAATKGALKVLVKF